MPRSVLFAETLHPPLRSAAAVFEEALFDEAVFEVAVFDDAVFVAAVLEDADEDCEVQDRSTSSPLKVLVFISAGLLASGETEGAAVFACAGGFC
jgi:hypothetical protein